MKLLGNLKYQVTLDFKCYTYVKGHIYVHTEALNIKLRQF